MLPITRPGARYDVKSATNGVLKNPLNVGIDCINSCEVLSISKISNVRRCAIFCDVQTAIPPDVSKFVVINPSVGKIGVKSAIIVRYTKTPLNVSIYFDKIIRDPKISPKYGPRVSVKYNADDTLKTPVSSALIEKAVVLLIAKLPG